MITMEVKPRARLIDYDEEAEGKIATAARLCYSRQGAEELQQQMSREEKKELVRKILDLGHYSTLEHAYFTFHIVCSRVTSHQLVRQRVGVSYSQRSQRYVKEDGFSYIIPPSIKRAGGQVLKEFKEHYQQSQELYDRLLDEDIPAEDARFLLPAIKTNLMVTYNARSLYHFFSLRCCSRAQWEIRSLARQMLKQVREVTAVLFEKAGADCEAKGECPEGDLSCGRIDKIKSDREKGEDRGK